MTTIKTTQARKTLKASAIKTEINLMLQEQEPMKVLDLPNKAEEVLCNRGLRFSRFKKHFENMPSNSFARTYFLHGGLVDSCGNWGYTPTELHSHEKAGVDPEKLGKLVKVIGRTDFGNDSAIIEMIGQGLEPRNRSEFGRNVRGLEKLRLAKKMGVVSLKSVISLGYMTEEVFAKWLLERATRVDKYDLRCVRCYIALLDENGDYNFVGLEVLKATIKSKFGRYALDCIIKDYKRYNIAQMGIRSCHVFNLLKSKKALAFYIQNEMGRAYKMRNRRNSIDNASTTVGKIVYKQVQGVLDLSTEGALFVRARLQVPYTIETNCGEDRIGYRTVYEDAHTKHQARKLGKYWVLKIQETWFVWEHSFDSHVEGNSLKSAIEMFEARTKKDRLILCLNDVRNDKKGTAGFCLSGTKSFAQARMPFLYNMIKNYSEWGLIPTEVMETEFHLASKTIFNGFASPVR